MESVMPWIWLGVIIITIIYEFLTYELESIWFTIGAVIALILSFFENIFKPWLQLLIFGIVSVIMLLSLKKWTKKIISTEFIPTNADSLIGKEITISGINSENVIEAKVNGIIWNVQTENNEHLEIGEIVIIKKINGNKLIVEKESEK